MIKSITYEETQKQLQKKTMPHNEAVRRAAAVDNAAAIEAKPSKKRRAVLRRLELLKWIPAFMKAVKAAPATNSNTPDSESDADAGQSVDLEYLKCVWDPSAIGQHHKVSLISKETKEMDMSSPMARALNNRPPEYGMGYCLANAKATSKVQECENMDMDAVETQGRIIFETFDKDFSGYLDVLEFKKFLRSAGANYGMSGRQFSVNARHDYKLLRERGVRGINPTHFVGYYKYMAARASRESTPTDVPVEEPVVAPADEQHMESPRARLHISSEFGAIPNFADIVKRMIGEVNARYASPTEVDTLGVGGLPSIVVAVAKGDMDLVVKLANLPAYARVLTDTERREIVHAARTKDMERLQLLMQDLFTKAYQRKDMFDAMMEDDIDLSRKRLKQTYYAHHGHTQDLPSDACMKPNGSTRPLMVKNANKRAAAKNKEKLNRRLVSACLRNDVSAVRQCLASGADPNMKDVGGSTPLTHTAWYGYIDVAKQLLDFGAEVNVKNLRGNTAMHFCLEKNNMDMLYLFLSKGGASALLARNLLGKTPNDLCSTILVRDISAMAMELAAKDSVHAPHRAYNLDRCGHKDGYIGKSADEVRKACSKGDLRRLKHLVSTGLGSIYRADRYGVSPLMHAVLRGHTKVIQYLLDQGVDVYHTTLRGNTALHVAIEKYERSRKDFLAEVKFRSVIKLLLTHGGESLRQMRNKEGNLAENI